MTHGCQTTAEEQMQSTLFNKIAKKAGFVVLYPDIDLARTCSSPGRYATAGASTSRRAGTATRATPGRSRA